MVSNVTSLCEGVARKVEGEIGKLGEEPSLLPPLCVHETLSAKMCLFWLALLWDIYCKSMCFKNTDCQFIYMRIASPIHKAVLWTIVFSNNVG